MQLVPLLELQNLCTLNADLLKMLSSKMLASKTKECEILRNELKELNDSVKSKQLGSTKSSKSRHSRPKYETKQV